MQNNNSSKNNSYITNEQIMSNILADMTYASAHWISEVRTSISYKLLIGECVEDKWFNCLKNGGKLIIIDNEDYEEHTVNFKQLSKAISSVRHQPRFKDETSWDEYFVDNIIQIAVFGEVVFG